MSRRFAALYLDGSLGVEVEGVDLISARKRLLGSSDDDTTEIVEIELKVVKSHGTPKLQKVTEHSAICPMCKTEVFIDVPQDQP
jgi:hypothetical protein